MGLDNGIVIKKIKINKNDEDFPAYFYEKGSENEEDNTLNEIEICYWRKFWGFRNEIVNMLSNNYDDNKYEYEIKREDVPKIIKILTLFLNKKYYEENARSIWEYYEQVNHIGESIGILAWLYEYMKDHKDIEVYFYDSY